MNESKLEKSIELARQEVKTDKMDFSVGELINMYKNHELVIRPSFQRLYQWDQQRKTDFIESILLGIPIPSIFVVEKQDGTWHLVDGLQRMTTILTFTGDLDKDDSHKNDNAINNFELTKGSKVSELDEYSYKSLPRKYQLGIKRSSLRVEIIKGDNSNTGVEYELFKRLNSGGITLNKQEMRNALYRDELQNLFDYIDNKLENL